MSERDFIYWLKGFFEASGKKSLDEKEVKIIKEHLDLMFVKVTGEQKLGEVTSAISEMLKKGPHTDIKYRESSGEKIC